MIEFAIGFFSCILLSGAIFVALKVLGALRNPEEVDRLKGELRLDIEHRWAMLSMMEERIKVDLERKLVPIDAKVQEIRGDLNAVTMTIANRLGLQEMKTPDREVVGSMDGLS